MDHQYAIKAAERRRLFQTALVSFFAALFAAGTIALVVAIVLGNQAVNNAQANCLQSKEIRPAANLARAVQRGELRAASQLLGDTPAGDYYGRLFAQVEYLPDLVACHNGRQITEPLSPREITRLETLASPPLFDRSRP